MPHRPDVAASLVKVLRGPLATVYSCPFCKALIVNKHSRPGHKVGRGFGLRTGGAAHSKMRAHIRAAHPDKVAEVANA